MDLPSDYLIAEGPEGLSKVLDGLLEKSRQDAGFASSPHYIVYQLGNQKSLIKVDMSQNPFQFWFYDLLGRPATGAIRETLARFLWDKCGEKQQYLQELTLKE